MYQPEHHTNDHPASRRRAIKKYGTLFFGSLLILGLIWSAISSYRAVTAVRSLQKSQQKIEQILNNGLMKANPIEIKNLTADMRTDILTLRSALGPAAYFSQFFGWIPKYGPLLADSRDLLKIADLGSEASIYVMRAVIPVMIAVQNGDLENTGPIPVVAHSLESSAADFENAAEVLQKLSTVREELTMTAEWPQNIQRMLSQLDSVLPAAQDALLLGQVLPELLGSDGRKTYLLIAKNEDELRPTGGFISGAGLLVIEDGDILSIKFNNANLVDDWLNKPYGFPPLPFYEFMGMDIFLFRDANFWPDFPTSAEMAMQLYSHGQDVSLDGIIAFNQSFVQLLLEGTGPLYVPELEITVSSENVIEAMRQEWGPSDRQADWIIERKAFMGPFANAFLSQISGDLHSMDIRKLGENVFTAVEQRDLQIYMRDPALTEALAEAGWDGRLTLSPVQDYLMVVESNLGFNKANAAVDRSVGYDVTLDEKGQGDASLTIEFSHAGDRVDEECRHGTIYSSDTQYEDLISDCYWNYLRVLVPSGSQLITASSHPVPAGQLLVDQSWDGMARQFDDLDRGYTFFDNFLVLPPGQRRAAAFRYLLPEVVTIEPDGISHYRLAIDKQSGTGNQRMKITVNLPPGSELISSDPRPSTIGNQALVFDMELAKDQQIDVQYR